MVRLAGKRKSEEQARVNLQERMALYTMLVLVSIVAEITLLTITYHLHPDYKPRNADAIATAGGGGLAVLAILWRGLMARYKLSRAWLYRIDLFIAAGIGCFLAAGAYFADDLRPASYTALTLAYGLVFTRAIVVPSSGLRTLLTTTLTFVPLMGSAVGLAFKVEQEVPRDTFIGGALAFAIVAVILVSTGSRIIYGLQQKVSEAMQLGQYTLDRPIGEGGMGAVYRAHHALLRRPTAVKLLRPDRVGANLERFEREVQHMSQLTHPNTVAVFDYGHNDDGVFYYAMEYLDGIDLEQLVQRYGPQPPMRVAAILAQVCGALTEAHGRGLTHRDIKPANIILCERGGMSDVAKVVDFGLVKELTASTGASTQVILGTPAYLAPEAVNDPSSVGPAADLYGLGAVGYFLLTGKRVFDGKTAVEMCVQHVTATPVPPSSVVAHAIPGELEALILRCLAKAPAERPTAAELARALQPPAPSAGWSEDDARGWWTEFRRQMPAPSSSAEAITITVDVGEISERG